MTYELQQISDYLEIRDLSARYNRLADLGDGESYSKLFTQDAEFEIVGNRVYRGRKEIASAASATKVTVHITMDPVIELDEDEATQRSRLITCYRALDISRNEFVATGWYIDQLKRTSEGWRFFRRRCELDLDVSNVFEKMTIAGAFASLSEAGSTSDKP